MSGHKRGSHESFEARDAISVGSERSFGIVFAAVFLIIGLWPLLGDGATRLWALAVSGVLLVFAFAFPRFLRPLNFLWFKFGMLLNRVMSPVIMGVLFFLTVTPTAMAFRLLGKDPLRLRLNRKSKSYWLVRKPPGPAPDSMKNQF